MCMLCPAIPATAALGAAASAKQKAAFREQETAISESPIKISGSIPAGKATAVVIAGLLTASVLYHSQISAV